MSVRRLSLYSVNRCNGIQTATSCVFSADDLSSISNSPVSTPPTPPSAPAAAAAADDDDVGDDITDKSLRNNKRYLLTGGSVLCDAYISAWGFPLCVVLVSVLIHDPRMRRNAL